MGKRTPTLRVQARPVVIVDSRTNRDPRVTGHREAAASPIATVSPMLDRDLRAALHARLISEHAGELSRTLVVDELGLCGEVRVDVAVVNACLAGFELKSASDTLRRLPKQIEVYSRVLDFCTLVVAEKHLDKARTLVPEWWGVLVVRPSDGLAARLDTVAEPSRNRSIDPYSLAQLLWRDEALAVLEGLDEAYGCRSKTRKAIWQRVVEVCELDLLRLSVRSSLKSRQKWRSDFTSSTVDRELAEHGALCRS